MQINDENLHKTIASAQHLIPEGYAISIFIEKDYVYAEPIRIKPFAVFTGVEDKKMSISDQIKACLELLREKSGRRNSGRKKLYRY